MNRSVLAVSSLIFPLVFAGCSTTAESDSAQQLVDAGEEFSSSAEATSALADMKFTCTTVVRSAKDWVASSLPPDVDRMQGVFADLQRVLEEQQSALSSYDYGTIEIYGDESRSEPLFDSFRTGLAQFAGQVDSAFETATAVGVTGVFQYSANFLEESALEDFEALCAEVEDSQY